jgi:diaminopimelate decarboxylase
MGSSYNARPRSPEVLVEGNHWRVIRRRETIEELYAGESAEGFPHPSRDP